MITALKPLKNTPSNPLRFPTELLHKVLTYVVGNSIHAICTFPGDVNWELGIFEILCGVSSSFKAITTELFIKGFEIPSDESENLSRLITKKIDYLRILGMRLHHPSKYGSSFQSPDAPSGVPLMHGYALFMVAMDLRYNAIQSASETYELACSTILEALRIALESGKRVEPKGMAEVLCDAVWNEQELVHYGLEIVKAFTKLRKYLGSFQESADGSLVWMQTIFIHEELTVIENAHQRYTQVMPTCQFTPAGAQHQASELPGVTPTLRDLCTLQFGVDEYDIHGRLRHLVKEWSTVCPFLDVPLSS